MAISGKVARLHCWVAVVVVASSTAAFAAPLLPDAAQWRDYAPVYSQDPLPGGLTVVEQDYQGLDIVGELVGRVKTSVYTTPGGEYIFDYVIERDNAGSGAISFVSLDGPGWLGLEISEVGVSPTGSSGHGDTSPEWTDGTPVFISRDAQAGTPFWRYRTAVPGESLLGTLIGRGDTSAHVWFITNAVGVAEGSMLLSTDTGVNGRASILVPMVPEPATLTLLGAMSLLFVRRRRR